MSHYLNELNPTQRQAVMTVDGPVLIIAGPGSGKTRVLTYRIAYLLEQGIAPHHILALTFTNKAAREMKERIDRVVGNAQSKNLWAGTFHSIFARILRAEASKIGFPSHFSIYDTDDSLSLIRTIIKEMQLDESYYNLHVVRSRISAAKSALITPKLYGQRHDWLADDQAARRPLFHEVYQQYFNRCLRAGAMDFDDLLLRLFELFQKNPDGVREKYQQRFRYVLVDEFQDTNTLQYAILKQLVDFPGSPHNICVVGDDAQSIYAFRGATIDNILNFENDYKSLKIFKLEQNYRSTHHIVQAANEIIRYNKRQLHKSIFTVREDRQKIKLLKCKDDQEEAKRVADLILEQKNRYHLVNSDIAILYRTNAQSRRFEEQLRRYNLQYRIFGGMSFYQRKEVKDFLAYLRLVVNHNDEEALRRIINYPTRGIGATTLDKIGAYALEHRTTMWHALSEVDVPEKTRKILLDFRNWIDSLYKKLYTENAAKLAAEIARRSGMLDALKADTSPEGKSRLENLEAILDDIGQFMDKQLAEGMDSDLDLSLAAFLQTVSLHTDADEDKNPDAITLMSVHAAKGLEFRSVFVTGLEEQLFPSHLSLSDSSGHGLEEERRLFYVALTRAKDFLILSYATERYRNGQLRLANPSRFLDEISAEHFEISSGRSSADEREGEYIATSSISGSFIAPRLRRAAAPAMPIENFQPSPLPLLVVGVQVLHQKFGKGLIKSVEGAADDKVATIQFEAADVGERRIMLKFAKLMVV